MSLNATVLSQSITSSLGITDPQAQAAWLQVCQLIVLHIQTNALVNTTLTATAGPYPVAGVGIGTVS